MSSDRYQFKIATTPRELLGYWALRHHIFVEEQQLFRHSDVDSRDSVAYPIVALQPPIDDQTADPDQSEGLVVGIVRIYEAEPGIWYGGRLGTHADYRRGWHIGKGLIQQAVSTANSWGCDRFFATVQLQNVRFFQRLHWRSLGETTVQGCLHHRMEADLNYYPPLLEPPPRSNWHWLECADRHEVRVC